MLEHRAHVVEDPDGAVGSHRDGDWIGELAGSLAEGAPGRDEATVAIECLDPPVADIEDEERAVRLEGERPVTVAVAAAEVEVPGGVGGCCPLLQQLPIR